MLSWTTVTACRDGGSDQAGSRSHPSSLGPTSRLFTGNWVLSMERTVDRVASASPLVSEKCPTMLMLSEGTSRLSPAFRILEGRNSLTRRRGAVTRQLVDAS